MCLGYNIFMEKKNSRIINGTEYWKCPLCGKWFPSDKYYKDKRTSNGLKSQCKKCHTKGNIKTRDIENTRRINREYMRRARMRNPYKFQEREKLASRKRPIDQKSIARQELNCALKTGKIIKPKNCALCGKEKKLTAHHPDHSKPLDVIWLCYECHGNK